MKKNIQYVLIASLALSTVNLLTSCSAGKDQPKFKLGVSPAFTPSEATALQQKEATSKSSSESTSANDESTGFNVKNYTSSVVKPTDLQAYKETLKSLFENIKNEDPSNAQTLARIFDVKTWYIAKVDLSKIAKNVLTTSTSKSDNQQIAKQTLKEVWIDQQVYDSAADDDKAEILLHELVTSMYLLKFIPAKDLCAHNILLKCSGDALTGQVLPPEKAHILTKDDNENIQDVTDWILDKATQEVSMQDLQDLLVSKNFDKRLFKAAPVNIKVSSTDLYNAINSPKMPGTCTNSSLQSSNCIVDVQQAQIDSTSGTKVNGVVLKVQSGTTDNDSISISFENSKDANLAQLSETDGSLKYVYSFDHQLTNPKVGDRQYNGYIIFSKENDQTPLTLVSLVIKPGVVTKVDGSPTPICEVKRIKVQNFTDDTFIIKNSNQIDSLEQTYIKSPLTSNCLAPSV